MSTSSSSTNSSSSNSSSSSTVRYTSSSSSSAIERIINFTSWTACDDTTNPTLVWTTLNDVKGRLPLRYWEAIRQAILERDVIACRNEPTALEISLLSGNIHTEEWAQAVQAEVTALIPCFVNHTDHSGNWDNQTTLAPLWTEALLMANIGETRIPATHYRSAAWTKQQYEILRRLKWHGVIGHHVDDLGRWLDPEVEGWSAAVAAFNGGGWAATSGASYHWAQLYAPDTYNIYRNRAKFSPYNTPGSFTSWWNDIGSGWDLYLNFVGPPNNGAYSNNDYPVNFMEYLKVDNGVYVTGGVLPESISIGNFETATVRQPLITDYGLRCGYGAGGSWFIRKFDVVGGFTFGSS